MKVLEIVLDNRLGGISVRALNVANRMATRGVETILITPNETGTVNKMARSQGMKAHTILLKRPSPSVAKLGQNLLWALSFPLSVIKISQLIKRYNIDVVHINGLLSLQGAVAAWLCRIPLVWHLAATSYPKPICRLLAPFLRYASYPVSISPKVREYFLGTNHLRENERIIFEPIDFNAITNAKPADDKLQLLQKHGFKSNTKICLSVGNLSSRKGFHVLLNAWKNIAGEHSNWKCLVAGAMLDSQKNYVAQLKNSIKELKLDDHFYLLGERHDIFELLHQADLFCLPSFQEGTPISIMEAMAAKLPIIATSVGGIPDQIDEGISGLLIPPGDDAKLAAAIAHLIQNDEIRSEMGISAQQTANTRFSMDNFMNEFNELLNTIVSNNIPSKVA